MTAGSFSASGVSAGSSNYPYVTARIRALKTHLLPEEEYPKLVARDEHAIARRLEEGRYQDEVNELASEYSGAQLIEHATQEQMGDEFQRILSWCKGEPEALLGLYFERFIVQNIKTVLRGVNAGADPARTRAALIPAGLADPEAWTAAAETTTREACVAALPSTRYTSIVEDHAQAPVREVENALDRAYYETLVETIEPSDRPKEAFLAFIRREIDLVNLKLLLRSKHAGVDPGRFVDGGKEIKGKFAGRLRSADWAELPDLLEQTAFGADVREALTEYLELRDLNGLVSAIENLHLEEADQFGFRYPLSILPIVDYVLRKRLEVERLRMIAFGKQTGLSNEEIEAFIDV